jgi:hypothetical protein
MTPHHSLLTRSIFLDGFNHQVLTSRLGAVFVPGIANILHSNYVISSEFLKSMALLAGAAHQQAVQKRCVAIHRRALLACYDKLR